MVARIHYRESGVEYVLQYNSTTDTIELRRNHFRLIGGIPNYFRDEWGTSVYEMRIFQETLLDTRPSSNSTDQHRLPRLYPTEQALIHEFEKIASINLLLTIKSVREHRFRLMQETARSLPGIDITTTLSFLNRFDRLSGVSARQENERDTEPPLTDEPPIAQEAPSMNTEGFTEEEMLTLSSNMEIACDHLLLIPVQYAQRQPLSHRRNHNRTNPSNL